MRKFYKLMSFGFIMLFLTFAQSMAKAQNCQWTVSLSGSYGDQISWQLRGADETVVLSGGSYTGYGFSDEKTVTAEGPLEFYIETMGGDWGDNVVSYYVSNENGVVATGTLLADLESTRSGLNCSDLALATSEGCLDSPFDAYPIDIYTPSCVGVTEIITTGAYAGQYSSIAVTAGSEYVFSSSIESDFITVGNEAGTLVLAHGEGSVTWTSETNQVIRFYTHTDAYCNGVNIFRERKVLCGEAAPPPTDPDFDCFQGDGLVALGDENAFSISSGPPYRTVDDFIVEEGTTFNLQQVRLNVVAFAPVFEIHFVIYSDDNGTPTNDVVATTEYIVPTSQILRGYNDIGFPIYEVTADLTEPIEFEAGTYWLLPQADGVGGGDSYWGMTSLGSNGGYTYSSEGEGPWVSDERNYNAVFFVAGECNDLGVSDLNAFDFNYYPNPVNDVLNLSSKITIKEVSAFNVAGQKMFNLSNIKSGKVDVSKLNAGTYFFKVKLENGQVETFKVLKK